MRYVVVTIVSIVITVGAVFANPESLVRKGNKEFRDGDFKEALDFYNQAEIEAPQTPEIAFNQGTALLKAENYDTAAIKFEQALNTDDADLQAAAYYNLGNTHFEREDYMSAINSYRKTLEINPDDLDAKYNLELARNRLKEQMENQEQNQDEQQQEQEEKEKQEQEEQEQQQQGEQEQEQEQPQPQEEEQQEEEQQQQQQQQQEQQEQDEEEQQQQPQPQPDTTQQEMSKEDAERILRALEEAEQENTMKRKVIIESGYRGNDW